MFAKNVVGFFRIQIFGICELCHKNLNVIKLKISAFFFRGCGGEKSGALCTTAT